MFVLSVVSVAEGGKERKGGKRRKGSQGEKAHEIKVRKKRRERNEREASNGRNKRKGKEDTVHASTGILRSIGLMGSVHGVLRPVGSVTFLGFMGLIGFHISASPPTETQQRLPISRTDCDACDILSSRSAG